VGRLAARVLVVQADALVKPSNAILAALPDDAVAKFAGQWKAVDLRYGEPVHKDLVLFPESALVALEVPLAGGRIITGVIGRSGVANAVSAFDVGSVAAARVLVPGRAHVIRASTFRAPAEHYTHIVKLLLTAQHAVFREIAQSAACNAVHDLEGRLCRWILRMREELGDRVPVKQSDIADMLGVQRSSVSQCATRLHASGFIAIRRGAIQVRNPAALGQLACACKDSMAVEIRSGGVAR
jgi:CRP-like cAMP-binding protein